ncbi:MAG: hypothetical protein ABIQ16_17770, partial [Polyangiaceae bacterium]
MNRIFNRIVGLSIFVGCSSVAAVAAAEAPLTGPSLETHGKPINPPAPTDGPAPKLGGISLLVGVTVADMGPINDHLKSNRTAFPKDLPSVYPMFGAQGYGLVGRFVIGGSGAAIFSRTVDEAADRKLAASGGWGSFDFGYQVLRVNGFMIAPVLSLGGYGMNLTVAQKGAVNFDEALANNRSTTMSNEGILTGISLLA